MWAKLKNIFICVHLWMLFLIICVHLRVFADKYSLYAQGVIMGLPTGIWGRPKLIAYCGGFDLEAIGA